MSTARLLARIRREFKNHPGIVVTLPQAQSLWSLDKSHCTRVLETLTAEGFLNRVGDVYLWPEAPTPRFKIVERTRAHHCSRASRISHPPDHERQVAGRAGQRIARVCR